MEKKNGKRKKLIVIETAIATATEEATTKFRKSINCAKKTNNRSIVLSVDYCILNAKQ
jgi:hypothetical protein